MADKARKGEGEGVFEHTERSSPLKEWDTSGALHRIAEGHPSYRFMQDDARRHLDENMQRLKGRDMAQEDYDTALGTYEDVRGRMRRGWEHNPESFPGMKSGGAIATALRIAREGVGRKKRARSGEIENKNHPDYGITEHERAPDHEYEPEPFNLDAMPKQHTGAIASKVSGRTDHLPMHVPSGSHVLPADVVSALGEGNTASGFRIVKDLFAIPGIKMKGLPYGAQGLPYGVSTPAKAAAGGRTKGVPIIAAGGEHVLTPQEVEHVARRFGSEDRDDGHAILDEFIKQVRRNNIKTLRKLPGPARN